MPSDYVLSLYDSLKKDGITIWIDGGWCIDALLGKKTREHSDLDIAVDRKDNTKLRKLLEDNDYIEERRNDSAEWMYVMKNTEGDQVDVHVFEYDEDGKNIYGVEYPFGSLGGTGTIGGKEVNCIDPKWMFKFKTAYEPKEKDLRDVRALSHKFGFKLPAQYQEQAIDRKIVVAVTGPSGAGKSTVSERLAKQLDRCVNIDADHIKHMIVSGFYKDDSAGGWGFNQWGLVGDSIGLLARNFLDTGYSVIINGYIDEPAWANIQKHVSFTHKVLLLPHLDTVTSRDAGRREDVRMGAEAVSEHHTHFSADEFFNDFIKLDSTDHSADETATEIMKVIKGL
jgi:lincosamide nucleotidyltransferase A/C/D/E